jgi:hypothetical protein
MALSTCSLQFLDCVRSGEQSIAWHTDDVASEVEEHTSSPCEKGCNVRSYRNAQYFGEI